MPQQPSDRWINMKYSAKECECKIYFYVEDKIGKVKDVFIAKRQDILLENVLKIRKEIIEITAIGLKDTIIRGIIIKIEILMEIVIEMIELETERSILREEEENTRIGDIEKTLDLDHFLILGANSIVEESLVLALVLLKVMVAKGMLIGIMTSGEETAIEKDRDRDRAIWISLVDAEIAHFRVLDLNLLDD